MGGGCQQQRGGGQGKRLQDSVAAIPEGKVNETRHSDWTAPLLIVTGLIQIGCGYWRSRRRLAIHWRHL